jgi:PAS domain S-box-containing protein
MRLYFEKHVLAGILVVLVVLIFLGWYSFSNMQQLLGTAKMLSHASRVINNAEQVMKASVDIETGQRGYVITGDKEFLEPSEVSKGEIFKRLTTLDSLTKISVAQHERVTKLRLLINTQLQRFENIIEVRHESFEEARKIVESKQGKRNTDLIRLTVAEIQDEERKQFRNNNKVTTASLTKFQYSFIGLVITVTILVVILFYSINQNLRARKLAELRLEKSVQETQDLYDNAPCGYLSVDSSIFLSRINKTLLNWLGYSAEEVIGKMKYEDLLAPGSREKFLSSFQEDFEKYKNDGQINDLEFEFVRKDGTTFSVLINSIAMFNDKDEFISSRTTVFDNSDRKKIQDKFKGLLEAAPDASVIANADGVIEMINNQCQNVFGYSSDELVGKKVELLIPERHKNIHPKHREEFFKNPTVRPMGVGLDLWGLRKNGEEFPIEISLSPIKTDDGLLVSASIRDITERKNYENTINKLNKELESFTYSVSHDLRAPLRSIAGYAQILKEDYSLSLDEDGQRITNIVIANAKRMGQLIDDLLDFSRMGRKEMMKGNVNMDELVKDIVKEMAVYENGKQLNINLQPLEPSQADMTMLRLVWTNLLSNAIKYSSKKETAKVEVGSYKTESECCYYVRDNGAGFDMQYANKLFGVFQRLHKMNEFEGTGVGLALVKTIIERHGGRVWAEGKLNEGATFYFTIPSNN